MKKLNRLINALKRMQGNIDFNVKQLYNYDRSCDFPLLKIK